MKKLLLLQMRFWERESVTETAGSLQEGKRVWLLARMPREFIILGERTTPYLVFSNAHDGSGAVKTALVTDPGSLQQYVESGIEYGETFLVYDSYGEYQ